MTQTTSQKPLTAQQAEELVRRWDEVGGMKTSAYYRLKQIASGDLKKH